MKNLRFILKENVDRVDLDGNLLPDKVSTFGFKFEFKGELYGDYWVFNKPTMTVQDIMDAFEELCPLIERTLETLQADTKSI